MPERLRHPDSSERGSAMIEFAFTAIAVFTLLFGSMLLALAFYTYEVVNQYARDASRYAMVHGAGCTEAANGGASCDITGGATTVAAAEAAANPALKTFLNTEIFPAINGNNLTVSTVYGLSPANSSNTSCTVPACNAVGDQVTVTVSYPYLYAIPFLRSQSFTMNSTSSMTISQ